MEDTELPPAPKADPFGGTPKDTQPAEDPKSAAKLVEDAKASGALKPLEDVMKEQGWDLDPATALLLAQKKQAPGTQGKSPQELADMLRSDPSVYEDLQALQPGGALDALGKKDAPAPSEADESAEKEMGDYMAKSETLKGKDPKKGLEKMKQFGAKKPDDLDKDVGAKSSFLSKM